MFNNRRFENKICISYNYIKSKFIFYLRHINSEGNNFFFLQKKVSLYRQYL
jgi:hypothetical protein